MGGTRAGGIKAAQTNKEKYGPSFYSKIGQKGGRKSTTGGFWRNRDLARTAGKLGGTVSRRGNAMKLSSEQKAKVLADIKAGLPTQTAAKPSRPARPPKRLLNRAERLRQAEKSLQAKLQAVRAEHDAVREQLMEVEQ